MYGGDSNNTCSCSDIFTIRFQSLYLAHAMKNFVENVTGHAHCKSVDMEAVTDKCNTSHE